MLGIISFFIVWFVVVKMIWEYESPRKIMDKYDKDPNCPLKSNKWYKEHPEDLVKFRKSLGLDKQDEQNGDDKHV